MPGFLPLLSPLPIFSKHCQFCLLNSTWHHLLLSLEGQLPHSTSLTWPTVAFSLGCSLSLAPFQSESQSQLCTLKCAWSLWVHDFPEPNRTLFWNHIETARMVKSINTLIWKFGVFCIVASSCRAETGKNLVLGPRWWPWGIHRRRPHCSAPLWPRLGTELFSRLPAASSVSL